MAKTHAKRWTLLVKSSSFADTLFEIEKAELVVGRVKSCDLSIRSEAVSRQHIRLSSKEGALFVEDLKSSNGVLLNGKKIPSAQSVPVKIGDVLGLGSSTSSLRIESVDFLESEGEPTAPAQVATSELSKAPAVLTALSDAEAIEKQLVDQLAPQGDETLAPPIPEEPLTPPTPEQLTPEDEIFLDSVPIDAKSRKIHLNEGLPEPGPAILAPSPAFSSSDRGTNVDRLLRKQKSEEELAKIQSDAAVAFARLERLKEEEDAYIQIKRLEKNQIEAELRDLAGKQTRVRDSFAHNQRALAKQEERLQALETRLSEQESVVEARSKEILDLKKLRDESESKLRLTEASLQAMTERHADSEKQIAASEERRRHLAHETQDLESALAALRELSTREQLAFDTHQKQRRLEISQLEADAKLIETRSQTAIEEKKSETLRITREKDEREIELDRLRKTWTHEESEKTALLRGLEARLSELSTREREVSSKVAELSERRETLSSDLEDFETRQAEHLRDLREFRENFQVEQGKRETYLSAMRAEREKFEGELSREREEQAARLLREKSEHEAQIATRHANQQNEIAAVLSQERNMMLEESKRRISRDKIDAAKSLERAQNVFDEKCRLESRRLDEELQRLKRESDVALKRDRAAHDEHVQLSLAEFRAQKSREEALREKIFVESILGSFFEASKVHGFQIAPRVLPDFEAKVRGLLKSLHLASDEERLKALEKEKPWLKLGQKPSTLERFQRPALYASFTLSALLLVYVLSGKGGIKQWATAQEEIKNRSYEAKMASLRAEANRAYAPARDHIFKSSYTDNVLFLDNYAELVLDDNYRRDWILRLNQFFTKEIPNGDRRAPQFLAVESTLLNELVKLRATVNAKNPDPGIKRMRDLEALHKEKLVDIAGTQRQWDKIRALEQEHFLENSGSRGASLRSPASNSNSN